MIQHDYGLGDGFSDNSADEYENEHNGEENDDESNHGRGYFRHDFVSGSKPVQYEPVGQLNLCRHTAFTV
jgi:hypothetical protein